MDIRKGSPRLTMGPEDDPLQFGMEHSTEDRLKNILKSNPNAAANFLLMPKERVQKFAALKATAERTLLHAFEQDIAVAKNFIAKLTPDHVNFSQAFQAQLRRLIKQFAEAGKSKQEIRNFAKTILH